MAQLKTLKKRKTAAWFERRKERQRARQAGTQVAQAKDRHGVRVSLEELRRIY